ncbi:hypothetical protein ACLESO_00455 [Pyxidicoccus sp. 3LG]
MAALRPARVTWLPEAQDATLAGWGELAQLPGAKVLVMARAAGASAAAGVEAALEEPAPSRPAQGAASCSTEALPGPLTATRARVALRVNAGTPVDGPPCGLGRRVRVTGPPDDAALVALFSRMPSAELELEVGSHPAALANARAWVERLEAAVHGSGK